MAHGWMLLALLAAAQDAEMLVRQGQRELNAGRLEAAEETLLQAARLRPESAGAHYYLGVARFRMQRLPEAEAALERAVRLDGSRAPAWKAHGAVLAAQNKYHLAEPSFKKACELDPREENACYYLGRNYYELNRYHQAVAAYEKALLHDLQKWRAHNGMALSLEGLQRASEAERHFRHAVGSPANAARPDENPRIDLGGFLYRQGRLEEALEQLRQAVSESPGSARGRIALARALMQGPALEEAATHLNEALRLEPENAAAHLLLGKILHRLGRGAEGDRHARLGAERTTK